MPAVFQKEVLDLVEGGEIVTGRAQFDNLLLEVPGCDADGVFFPGGVDVGQDHMVGQCQRLGKIRQQGVGAGVGVGLEDAP